MSVLVFNAGSATLKFALIGRDPLGATLLRGSIEHFGPQARLRLDRDGRSEWVAATLRDPAEAAAFVVEHLRRRGDLEPQLVVAHRFVHGGEHHRPLRLDARSLAALEALVALAPLHLPPALAVARAARRTLGPEIPDYAVFDTAFFHALPAVARDYALPAALGREHHLRRYGFHGLAHRSLYAGGCVAHDIDPGSARVISFQLGAGCSAAAIDSGSPLDCSMGFTPLEGLVMATRAGDLDPGLLLHLLRGGMTLDALEELLQRRSGLLGVSGESGDMRRLLELEHGGHAAAHLAIELFCQRVRKYLGAYLAVLGGADAIVFGGGIGEHAADIRARCLRDFAWAGIHVDAERNRAGGTRITTDGSPVQVYVVPTDEESLIAHDALSALHEHA